MGGTKRVCKFLFIRRPVHLMSVKNPSGFEDEAQLGEALTFGRMGSRMKGGYCRSIFIYLQLGWVIKLTFGMRFRDLHL